MYLAKPATDMIIRPKPATRLLSVFLMNSKMSNQTRPVVAFADNSGLPVNSTLAAIRKHPATMSTVCAL